MMDVEKKQLKKYQREMLDYFEHVYPEIGREIEEKKVLSDELAEKIVKAAEEFRDKNKSLQPLLLPFSSLLSPSGMP